MVSIRNYVYEGVTYEGTITRKWIRSFILRIDPEKKTLRVSAPMHASDKAIDKFVTTHFPKLLRRITSLPRPSDDSSTYVFGEKTNIVFATKQEEIAYLKKVGMPYLEERVRYYEGIMGIKKPYKLRIRDMKSRYGSNSKGTHALSFAATLFHYSRPTIDSVIVHELAHDFVRNHSSAFYKVVYTYDPNYKIEHRKLTKHIYG